MIIKHQLLTRLYHIVAEAGWSAIGLLAASHFLLCWVLLALTGDPIASPRAFWYFYAVTAGTVGYGDLAPTNMASRAVVALLVIPGGIVIFTALITKLVTTMASRWRRRMHGQGDYAGLATTVILGWHPGETPRLIQQLKADLDDPDEVLVLVASDISTNPEPDNVHFVRATTLTGTADLKRAGVPSARRLLVDAGEDGKTLAAALAAIALNPKAHAVVAFDQPSTADVLKAHCPHAECVLTTNVGILARSLADPGASRVVTLLNSTFEGPTQYSLVVPPGTPVGLTYDALLLHLRRTHRATLIGITDPTTPEPVDLNAIGATPVRAGDRIYYIADRRIESGEVAWASATG